MSSMEIDLDTAAATIDIHDGRRVVVLCDDRGEVILRLPDSDPDRPVYRLGLRMDRLAGDLREMARDDAHRGTTARPGSLT